jgi:ribokinase
VLLALDVLVVNATEAAWLALYLQCQPTAAALCDRLSGVAVIVTRGGEGAEVAAPDAIWQEAAHEVAVVDTTAAGDCFVGVLAHRLDRGETLRDSVRRANVAAALCCMRHGSQGSIPTRAETEAFITRGDAAG